MIKVVYSAAQEHQEFIHVNIKRDTVHFGNTFEDSTFRSERRLGWPDWLDHLTPDPYRAISDSDYGTDRKQYMRSDAKVDDDACFKYCMGVIRQAAVELTGKDVSGKTFRIKNCNILIPVIIDPQGNPRVESNELDDADQIEEIKPCLSEISQ